MANGYFRVSSENSRVLELGGATLIALNTPVPIDKFNKAVLIDFREITSAISFNTPTFVDFNQDGYYSFECDGTAYDMGIATDDGIITGFMITAK